MTISKDHVSICICTYKRPQLLERLLVSLIIQEKNDQFDYSIVIIDNDKNGTAESIYNKVNSKSKIKLNYMIEPIPNIAVARNRAINLATGNYIAFIDDDELPIVNWLLNLYTNCNQYNADGILGPVLPSFESKPPKWALKSQIYERPRYKTGTCVHWSNSRTGNLLFKRSILENENNPFNENYKFQGEDVIFFRKMNDKGYFFIWCNEAVVKETVPKERMKIKYLLRRASLQGYTSLSYYDANKVIIFIKSSAAFIIYTILLPIFSLLGLHILIKYLIKDIHHLSRLLGIFGIKLIGKRNI